MRQLLFLALISFLSSACNKTEFKETKIASQTMPVAQQMAANNELPPGHPAIPGKSNEVRGVDVEKIAKAKNGVTVAECFAKNPKLQNTKIIIRGKIVKYNSGIMGKNWIHLRDGTGSEGKNDLVVTTTQNAKVGDTITASGILQYDKDIGSGYFFPAIVENAEIKAE